MNQLCKGHSNGHIIFNESQLLFQMLYSEIVNMGCDPINIFTDGLYTEIALEYEDRMSYSFQRDPNTTFGIESRLNKEDLGIDFSSATIQDACLNVFAGRAILRWINSVQKNNKVKTVIPDINTKVKKLAQQLVDDFKLQK